MKPILKKGKEYFVSSMFHDKNGDLCGHNVQLSTNETSLNVSELIDFLKDQLKSDKVFVINYKEIK